MPQLADSRGTMSFLAFARSRLVRRLAGNWCLQDGSVPCFQRCKVHFLLDGVEDEGESTPPALLAKSLACLVEESALPADDRRRPLTRMERKRLAELRIKKRVKGQYMNGKFYDVMRGVVAKMDTLEDAYDILRLNSNVDLASSRDDICFHTLSAQLASGDFDVRENTLLMVAKRRGGECLVLPKLNLKVIQEAVRVVLEVVFRPHFSKISHGCRSGRGHHSALRFICKEIGVPDWCFIVPVYKEVDNNVVAKLISEIEEKIKDAQLVSFIHEMFDARVVNLVFGGFPKGHGLPQEGVLAPILMNIYLDSFDREIYRICMRYEALGSDVTNFADGRSSSLRHWFRSQLKDRDNQNDKQQDCGVRTRVYACRYMDEIFIAVAGSKDVAENIKSEILAYLSNSLYLDVNDRLYLMPVRRHSHGLQFAGTVIRVLTKESNAMRSVHKLRDKIRLFASQKQEIWDAMNLRVGKKWLAYGLRRIKESEIKQLGLSTPLLDHISQFRKEGMKTDHWFKTLLKVWMQEINAKNEANKEVLLSKYVAEPALPQDLRDSFYNFQKQVEDYVSLETAATHALMSSVKTEQQPNPCTDSIVIKIDAPVSYIKKCLHRYGLITAEGFPRHVSTLVLQDDEFIISWFSGLVCRWLNWFSEVDNFREIKLMIVECVRKSCIRTLAAKYRMYENLIEKRFELDHYGIPTVEDFEAKMAPLTSNSSMLATDEALMYGISGSALCVLTLSRVKVPTRKFNCFVMGCTSASPSMYTVHVKEKQRFPGWRTGFSTSIHSSLDGRRIGLCSQHVKDLYLGHISLQSVNFGVLIR